MGTKIGLLIILVIIVFLFGGKKLPQLGGAIGEAIKNFKKGVNDKGQGANKEPTKEIPPTKE
jgi:sec-independent protein translocase protein TatA